MVRSLRWRLQCWYALLLVGVVTAFGTILYLQGLHSRLREIDSDLAASAHYLDTSLRRWPPNEFGPPEERRPDFPRPPRWGGLPPRPRLMEELTPPGWFHLEGDRGRYFAIWRGDGSLIKAVNLPPGLTPDDYDPAGLDPAFYNRGPVREVLRAGPRQSVILVGRSTRRVVDEQRAFLARLLLAGLGVVLLGLVGGYWISSAIVRPVARISESASRISAENLSQRIPEQHLDSELIGLVQVLNGTFDRLEAAFAQLARFTADASHELRTPLAVLRSQAELALARPREAEEYRQALQACERAAGRLSSLVEGLLLLARADAGRLDLQRHRLDLASLVEEEAAELGPLAFERQVEVTCELEPCEVLGDEVALARVVRNLVENAIRYNHPGGTVRLRVGAERGGTLFTVADTGCGIPTDDLPHIFERFFRVDQSRGRDSGGTGLGLAICQSIVTAHGGTIEVESQLDQGTTFRVRLPPVARRSVQIRARRES